MAGAQWRAVNTYALQLVLPSPLPKHGTGQMHKKTRVRSTPKPKCIQTVLGQYMQPWVIEIHTLVPLMECTAMWGHMTHE